MEGPDRAVSHKAANNSGALRADSGSAWPIPNAAKSEMIMAVTCGFAVVVAAFRRTTADRAGTSSQVRGLGAPGTEFKINLVRAASDWDGPSLTIAAVARQVTPICHDRALFTSACQDLSALRRPPAHPAPRTIATIRPNCHSGQAVFVPH